MPAPKDKIKYEEWKRKQSETHKGKKVWNSGLKGEKYKQHYSKGFKGTFQKGNIPPLKGKKGIHVSPETEFKKGHKNQKQINKMKELWQDKKWRQNQINKRLGRHPTEETLRKIRGKTPHNKGVPQSKEQSEQHSQHMKELWQDEEFIKKTKEGMKKRIVTEESNKKRSANAKINPNYGMKNKFHTEESKEKNRRATVFKICNGGFVKISSHEFKIRSFLDKMEEEYVPQKFIKIKHYYPCDIFVPKHNLVIEVDGVYWHNYPYGTKDDKLRTEEMLEKGYKVLRLWDKDIIKMTLDDFRKIFEKVTCVGNK